MIWNREEGKGQGEVELNGRSLRSGLVAPRPGGVVYGTDIVQWWFRERTAALAQPSYDRGLHAFHFFFGSSWQAKVRSID